MKTKTEFNEWATGKIETARKRVMFVLEHWDQLESAGVAPSTCDPFTCQSLDIDRPTREQVLAVIKAIPGDWEKEPTFGLDQPAINYTLQKDGFAIRLWAAPPPPSCRLIEEEVEIPAQPARKEKRIRLECQPEGGAV